MTSIKLIFNSETKKLMFPETYEKLETYAKKVFQNLPQGFKFNYID